MSDSLAIRELVDAYAHCADRRDADGQKALFTEDAHFVVYMDGEGSKPTQELNGRAALTPVFADLNRYEATTHFNGQSTIVLEYDLRPARATAWPTTCSPRTASASCSSLPFGISTRSSTATALGCSPNASSTSIGQRLGRRIPSPGA